MPKLRFAIIGCGRIAKRHSELLGYEQIPNACLVAVCDLKMERAKRIGQKLGVPHYTDMTVLMENEDIDVVVVLTESGNHAKHVIELAKFGKHIVVEKPMALTLSDADKMISACAEANIKLFVVKQNRFNVPVIKLKGALDEGRFGKIVMGTVRVRWSREQQYYDQDPWRGTLSLDGGVLANQASHHIDLLEWMLGEPVSVYAKGKTALVNIEAEDTAVAIIKFSSGAFGVVEATTATRPRDLEGSISILGEMGSVVIDGFAVNKMTTWNFVDQNSGDKNVLDSFSVNPPNVYGFGHQAYYENVVKSILDSERQLVDGQEGRKSLELILAMYESMETGLEVELGKNKQSTQILPGNKK